MRKALCHNAHIFFYKAAFSRTDKLKTADATFSRSQISLKL